MALKPTSATDFVLTPITSRFLLSQLKVSRQPRRLLPRQLPNVMKLISLAWQSGSFPDTGISNKTMTMLWPSWTLLSTTGCCATEVSKLAAYIKILIFLSREIQTAIHLILPGELLKSLWIPSLLLSSPAQVPHSLVNYKIMFGMSLHNKGSGKQTFSTSFQVPLLR